MTSTAPRLHRLLALLACTLASAVVVVVAASPASGHASLLETTPFDGQTVQDAPAEVTWVFNETVTSTTGALRIFDAAGERVDTGEQTHPAPDTLTVGLRDDVPTGSYVATYRVTSADGHVIRGAFVFQVGDAAGIDEDTLAAIFAGGSDGILAAAAGVGRAVGYLGAFMAGGALLWAVAVARGPRRDDEQARAAIWARRGAVAAAAAAVAAIPLQAMLTSGLGLGALTSGTVLAETVRSSVGFAAVIRVVAAAAVLALLRVGPRPAGAAGLALLGSFLLDGHTRTVEPAWLLWPGDAVHLLAGAAWFGGLVLLVLFLRDRRLADDPVGAADVVARFSRLATWALVAATVAGSAMAWALVRQPRALTSTEYGWTLLAKVAIVSAVLLVGAYNNRRLVPAITRAAAPAGGAADGAATDVEGAAADPDRQARIGTAAWGQLRRTARFEAGALVAVLAITAFMVNLRPAAEEAGITGAFDTLVPIEDTVGLDGPIADLQFNLVVDPNRVGFNEIHLYILDRTGRPVSDLHDVTLELSQPERDIGPIIREPFVAGPGHWQIDGRDLGVPGEWVLELVVGIDRFTEARVLVPVTVNP